MAQPHLIGPLTCRRCGQLCDIKRPDIYIFADGSAAHAPCERAHEAKAAAGAPDSATRDLTSPNSEVRDG